MVVKPAKKKQQQVIKASRQTLPQSRSLIDTVIKTGMSAAMTGNVPRALMYGAYDAATLLANQYLGSSTKSSGSGSLKSSTVSIPAATGQIMKGSMQEKLSGATMIRATADGVVVHQRVYVGYVGAAIATGNVYLYDSTGVDYTFIGPAQSDSLVNNTAPCFPVVAGQVSTGFDSDTLKQNFFFPVSTELSQLQACYEFGRAEQINIHIVPICPTTTQGTISAAWCPRNLDEFYQSTYTPGGVSNSFVSMSSCPYFASSPVWKGLSLTNIRPQQHGYYAGGTYLRNHFTDTSATGADPPRLSQIAAGTIILSVTNNLSTLATGTPLCHVFADYVWVLKGQHNRDFETYGYGSMAPLPEQERRFRQYLGERKRRIESKLTRYPDADTASSRFLLSGVRPEAPKTGASSDAKTSDTPRRSSEYEIVTSDYDLGRVSLRRPAQ